MVEPNEENFDNIRVVVGLDFGTTFSGFAYGHVNESENQNICSNDTWNGEVGQLKTNTVLQYDDEYDSVKLWGAKALAKRPNRRNKNNNEGNRPIELFKLHLGDLLEEHKPKLPVGYKKAIIDYLREIGNVIKETVAMRWPKIDYFEKVLLVLTVPAEFSENSKAIMRMCAFNAGLIKEKCSPNLQFTTEPEAAAIYCMENLKKENHAKPGTNFMIVDCGGGTVDLTTRKLIDDDQLDEITERAGDFCGSTFIDAEFIKYLRKRLGDEPMDLLRDNNYRQMQYLIQEFCKFAKIPFTGDDPDFLYELSLEDTVPILKQYVTDDDVRETLDEEEWVIEINFDDMKSIFEPVVQKILRLIRAQLDNAQEPCSAMFLVGGFSESKYLQKRIKEKFSHRANNNISVPMRPIAAIARGAALYGLSIRSSLNNDMENDDKMKFKKCVISTRVLTYTYGIKSTVKWEKGDPIHRKTEDGFIEHFEVLARRGTKMDINKVITKKRIPVYPEQVQMTHCLYCTKEYDPEYCDELGVKPLGNLHIDLPGSGLERPVLFGLSFGQMELTVTSKNKLTGQNYKASFKYLED